MINLQDFESAGYTQHYGVGGKLAHSLLQKCVKDEKGIKYFLNVYCYQFERKESFDADIQFYDKNKKNYSFCFSEFESVKELEDTVEEIWQKMKYGYDPVN